MRIHLLHMRMEREADVIIIGLGTAGLSAAREVAKVTQYFHIIGNGTYGTTCVRNGCMPSKILISAARTFRARGHMEECGIHGSESLRMDIPALLNRVRAMRAHFLHYALEETESFRAHIIEGNVRLSAPDTVEINGGRIRAKAVIIATGSRPIIPEVWQGFKDRILTSDTLFDQQDLPASIGVIGMSVLGAEMAQAFAGLGIQVTATHTEALVGGCTDPDVSARAADILGEEMELWLQTTPEIASEGDKLRLRAGGRTALVDKLFIAEGRCANLEGLGLEALGLREAGKPFERYDCETMQLEGERIFLAGDVTLGRAILFQAADEGRIAGYNAARGKTYSFTRRTPMQVCYTAPEICIAGASWEQCGASAAIGEARFENQGRALIEGMNQGIVRIYAERTSGRLLGSEFCAPNGEHLAHLLAWIIDAKLTVFEALRLPFYHPTVEEGLRTALQELAEHIRPGSKQAMELACLDAL